MRAAAMAQPEPPARRSQLRARPGPQATLWPAALPHALAAARTVVSTSRLGLPRSCWVPLSSGCRQQCYCRGDATTGLWSGVAAIYATGMAGMLLIAKTLLAGASWLARRKL